MKKINVFNVLCISLLIFTTGCKKDKGGDLSGLKKVDFGPSTLEPVEDEDARTEEVSGGEIGPDGQLHPLENSPVITCTTEKYTWDKANEETLLLNPASDVIYPGSMLGSGSIKDGSYRYIGGDRSDVQISISSNILGNIPNATVNAASGKLSDVSQAINQLLGQNITGDAGAMAFFEVEEVHSKDQMALSIGANAKFGFGSIEAGFDWSSSSQTRKFIAKFYQVFYTLSIDRKDSPEDYWNAVPDIGVFNGYVPVVVSSINYGRAYFYTMEFESDSRMTEATLSAQFSNGVNSGGFDSEFQDSVINTSLSSKLFAMGGNSSGVGINSPEALNQAILDNANFGSSNPGVPLSYKLAFIHDNSTAEVVSSAEYTVRNCVATYYIEPAANQATIDPGLTITEDDLGRDLCIIRSSAYQGGGIGDDDIPEGGSHTIESTVDVELRAQGNKLYADVDYLIDEVTHTTTGYRSWSILLGEFDSDIVSIDTDANFSVNASFNGSTSLGLKDLGQAATQEPGAMLSSVKGYVNTDGSNDFATSPYGSGGCGSKIRLTQLVFNQILVTLAD